MEDLQDLVAESLARNGFDTPEARNVQDPTASVEARLAASLKGHHSQEVELAPLPSGF